MKPTEKPEGCLDSNERVRVMFEIKLTTKESVLLDYVLTLHQYDENLLGKLVAPLHYGIIRAANAEVLCGLTDILEVDEADKVVFDEVIAMIPPIFIIGGEEVGFTLKCKLYAARFGWEDAKSGKDHTQNKTEDGAESEDRAIPYS